MRNLCPVPGAAGNCGRLLSTTSTSTSSSSRPRVASSTSTEAANRINSPISTNKKNSKSGRNSTEEDENDVGLYVEHQNYHLQQDAMVLRGVDEIIPRFDQFHMHLKKHLVRNGVPEMKDDHYHQYSTSTSHRKQQQQLDRMVRFKHRKPPRSPSILGSSKHCSSSPQNESVYRYEASLISTLDRESDSSRTRKILSNDDELLDPLNNSLIENEDGCDDSNNDEDNLSCRSDMDELSCLSISSVVSSFSDQDLSDVEMNPLDSPIKTRRRHHVMRKTNRSKRLLRRHTMRDSALAVDVDSEDVHNPGNLRLMHVRDDVIFLNNYVYIHDDANKHNIPEIAIVQSLDNHDHDQQNDINLSQDIISIQQETGCCANSSFRRCDKVDNSTQSKFNLNSCDLFGPFYGCPTTSYIGFSANNGLSKEAEIRRRKCVSIDESSMKYNNKGNKNRWMQKALTWMRGDKTNEHIREPVYSRNAKDNSYITGFNAPNLRLSNMLKETSRITSIQPDDSIEKGDGFPVEVTMHSRNSDTALVKSIDSLLSNSAEKQIEPSEDEIITRSNCNEDFPLNLDSPLPPVVALEEQSSDDISSKDTVQATKVTTNELLISKSINQQTLIECERTRSRYPTANDIIDTNSFDYLSNHDNKEMGDIFSNFKHHTNDLSSEQFLRKYGCRREDFLFLSSNEKMRIIYRGEGDNFVNMCADSL